MEEFIQIPQQEKKISSFMPSLLAGLLLGLLSSIPYISACNIICCLWVVGGGIFSIYLFTKDGGRPTNGDGAMIGFFAGLWGTLVATLVTSFSVILMGNKMKEMIFNQMATSNMPMDPTTEAIFNGIFSNPLYVIAISFLSYLVMNSIFATVGGILGVQIFKKKINPMDINNQNNINQM